MPSRRFRGFNENSTLEEGQSQIKFKNEIRTYNRHCVLNFYNEILIIVLINVKRGTNSICVKYG